MEDNSNNNNHPLFLFQAQQNNAAAAAAAAAATPQQQLQGILNHPGMINQAMANPMVSNNLLSTLMLQSGGGNLATAAAASGANNPGATQQQQQQLAAAGVPTTNYPQAGLAATSKMKIDPSAAATGGGAVGAINAAATALPQGLTANPQPFLTNNLLSSLISPVAGGTATTAVTTAPSGLPLGAAGAAAAATTNPYFVPQQQPAPGPLVPVAVLPQSQIPGQPQQQGDGSVTAAGTNNTGVDAATAAVNAATLQGQQPTIAMVPLSSLPQATQIQMIGQSPMLMGGLQQLQQYGGSLASPYGTIPAGLAAAAPLHGGALQGLNAVGGPAAILGPVGQQKAAVGNNKSAGGNSGSSDDDDGDEKSSQGTSSKKSKKREPHRKISMSHAEKWNRMFAKLQAYYDRHGDCLVPFHFKEDPQLGWWVHSQRRHYDNMVAERKERLLSLNFTWKQRNKESWDETFSRLIDFKKEHGHCLVPENYKEDPRLAAWVSRQRSVYKSLSSPKQKQLEEIGFEFHVQPPPEGESDEGGLSSDIEDTAAQQQEEL